MKNNKFANVKSDLGAVGKDAIGAIEELEDNLGDAEHEIGERDEEIDSLNHEVERLRELVESHWCCCGKCHA